jgi:phage I-like protein
MGIIKHVLMDKKFFEAEVEVEEFLDKKGINPNSVIQRLVFDKEVFPEKADVKEWMAKHFFEAFQEIEEKGNTFIVVQIDDSAFVKESKKTVEIRKGVEAVVGMLILSTLDNPFAFSLSNGEGIQLSADGLPHIIEVAKVVSGYHQKYGKVEITKEDLRSYVKNFNDNVTGVDVSIDFDHEKREAGGWFKELFLSLDEDVCYGAVKWTPKGALALSDREFRYFSPELHPDYVHPITGISHGPTLVGGALVNRPFLKMGPIVEMNEKNPNGGLPMDTILLSEHKTKVAELEKEIGTLKLSEQTSINTIAGLKLQKDKAESQVKDLSEKIQKQDRETKIAKLFTDKKITKAQKDAFESGTIEFSDAVYKVLSLSEGMKTTPTGSTAPVEEGSYSLTEEDKEMCKKFGLTEKEYAEANGMSAVE